MLFLDKNTPGTTGSARNRNKSAGISYIETALTLLIFVGALFFFVDAARYFYIMGVLNHAVHVGLDLASKLEVEISTTESDCQSSSCDDEDNPCRKFKRRWQRIRASVDSLADLVTTRHDVESHARRFQFKHFYADPQINPCLRDAGSDAMYADLALIRPGEKAARMPARNFPESHEFEISSRPFSLGWPQPYENWHLMLRDHPLAIRIDVEFKPVTPFFPPLVMSIEQYGRRLSRATGAALPALPPLPPTRTRTPTNTPQPTATITPGGPTPTSTPEGYQSPTPTLSPVPTPIPSPTPTFDCACCALNTCDYILCLQFCGRAH